MTTAMRQHHASLVCLASLRKRAMPVLASLAWLASMRQHRLPNAQTARLGRLMTTHSQAHHVRPARPALLLPRVTLGRASHVWQVSTRLHLQMPAPTARPARQTTTRDPIHHAQHACLASTRRRGMLDRAMAVLLVVSTLCLVDRVWRTRAMRVSLGRTRVQAHHRARSAPVALLTRTVIRQRTARRAQQARTPDAATHSATSVSLVRWTATRTLQHRVPLVRQVSTGRTARLSRPASVSSVLRGGRMPTSTVGRVALSVSQGRTQPVVQSHAMCAKPGRSITTSTRAQRALHAVLAPFGQLARQTPSARARTVRSVRLTRTATARQRVRAVQR